MTPVPFVRLVWLCALTFSAFGALGSAACGGGSAAAQKPAARVKLTPKEIVQRSSPAIVRVEAGSDRVGTGFIVGKGLIATNLHVVIGKREIRVVLYGGASVPVERIAGLDPDRDLILLGFSPPKELPSLLLGDSGTASAGDPVYAVNNPLGVLDYSVFDGLVSGVRPYNDKLTFLQVSVPTSQGSSGGPLFNQYGEVIGITSAVIPSGNGLALAIPINYLRPILEAPITVSVEEFAAATRDFDPSGGGGGGGDSSSPRIVRRVPDLDRKAFDGCSKPQVLEIVDGIRSAISSGAPVYNQGNHEACFRIYEGTAIKFEREAACPAIRSSFGDGLLRAGSVDTFTEKAWAMRDTFDGVLRAADDWAKNQPGGPVKFNP